ncbi:hypothetical protein [Gemmatimonas sp. UBA7669]|jgi:hypothetical protein|uniref:hypothetical protein n=1 Tax=Gemmatimonas sp. UBA7669 TaxID=1946568 RepID=UPI0025C3720A|nr:hypothetical protein [Gemmatimonas sp. UBA7669]
MSSSHQQSSRQLQESLTTWSVSEVLQQAVEFFARQSGIYSAFPEKQGPSHVVLRGQGGEELVIAARETPQGTAVSGSSYLFDQQVARFLASMPPVGSLPVSASAALPASVEGGA